MSSVTFSTAVGGDGSTVTDDNNATTGLREGGWKTRFVPCFTQQVAVANYVVTQANAASASATAAGSSATSAAAAYDSFDDRYLGSKASDPTLDNDGNALLTGAIYWNSSSNVMKVWSGSSWVSYNPAISYLALSGGTMTGAITFATGQFGTNVNAFLTTPSSANLAAALTDKTGTGVNVFNNTPTLITPILGTPQSGNLANCTFPTLNQNTTGTAATATNLASGSTGTIPYQSASGTTAMLATGTSGQVLTSVGAAAPTWANPSSGAMVLISSVTATAASTVEFLTGISSTYDTYIFEITNLYRTDGDGISSTDLSAQLYSDGAYVAGSAYLTHIVITDLSFTTYGASRFINQSRARLTTSSPVPNATGNANAYNGLITLTGVNSGRANLRSNAMSNQNNTLMDSNTNIYAQTIRGIKFYLDSGTINCTIRMYGISKS